LNSFSFASLSHLESLMAYSATTDATCNAAAANTVFSPFVDNVASVAMGISPESPCKEG
jgi:hypothetical protein